MTLEQANQEIANSGYRLGRSSEDDQIVYASSFASIPETFGHPVCEIIFNKRTGTLTRHV